MLVPVTKRLILLVRNQQSPSIPFSQVLINQQFRRVVFVLHDEDLEAFPTEGFELENDRRHVLFPIKFANYGIDLEFDTEIGAPVSDAEQLGDVLTSPASYLDVGGLVKTVAAHSQNVDIFPNTLRLL